MEQCHHYNSTTGQRCTNKATKKVQQKISSDSAAPKWWVCYTCSTHAAPYLRGMYEVYLV